VTYRAAGKLSEATAAFKLVADARLKNQGVDHPDTLTSLGSLALAYRDAGRTPEAIALFQQTAAGVARRRFQHEFASQIIGNTIAVYEQTGHFDRAEDWRRQWTAFVKQQSGPDSSAYAMEVAALSLNLLAQQRWTDAEPLLRSCLAIREKNQPEAWTTFNTMSMLGCALSGQKKYRDAEPFLLKGYEGMKAHEKTIPPPASARIPEAIDRLVEFYTALHKLDEVKTWKAERAKYPAARNGQRPPNAGVGRLDAPLALVAGIVDERADYPKTWPAPDQPNLLPPGTAAFTQRIEAEVRRRKAAIESMLANPGLTHFPRDEVRRVLSFWKVVL
jgi:tetratricopeptide (TPR) repeat protein